MTLELNIFHMSKMHMQPEEDVLEEACVIDTILEEQADQQDILDAELTKYAEEQEEVDMKSVQGYWKRRN